ncbi:hypothetical protein BFAG_00572 [Bacteroides fragilis 3_1_12]|uniref:Uncharacterized protein n=1 Tax=Bacteroides fragilis 3_1_12 TaxID=457424 RepID=A0ABN0BG07_BACFG|nr:hypothetical protein BFAG_00572 [Bacteroides fragilis 3_1_12]
MKLFIGQNFLRQLFESREENVSQQALVTSSMENTSPPSPSWFEIISDFF